MMNRRSLLKGVGDALAGTALAKFSLPFDAHAEDVTSLPFANGERPLARYPGKRPLIRSTSRPPQLETPFAVFNEGAITPNDAFYVRYHLADIPLSIDPDAFRIEVKGKVDRPLLLSLTDLKSGFEPLEIVAVNECSGNSRGFFEPRVGGGQLGNGAMGNARWRGVPLKSVLDKAGIQAGSRQVTFNGLDEPVLPETPDFIKALNLEHARDGEVMIAYGMNGEDLPWLNGYPVRLVVPGYYGTYWVKHLNEITVIDSIYDGFWMKSVYRIPDNRCACTEPGQAPAATVPINRLNVRSFITNLVARFIQIDGYKCLSLIRASAVVNCQSAFAWLAFRSSSQTAISFMRVCLSGMRRSRHWDERTPSSDSAISSQLPCFGV